MTNRLSRCLDKLRLAGKAGSFSYGRRLLLAGTALAASGTGVLLWRRSRTLADYGAEAVVRALCDRMLPAWGAHPGAIAVGVDAQVLDELTGPTGGERLEQLLSVLRDARFLELSPDRRDELLVQWMTGREDMQTSHMLRHILDLSVKHYFSHPDSWHALDYRQPQPLGYPDYAACRTESPS